MSTECRESVSGRDNKKAGSAPAFRRFCVRPASTSIRRDGAEIEPGNGNARDLLADHAFDRADHRDLVR
jgi:hypothetical protein